MQKPKHLIVVCASFRRGGEPQGKCHKRGSTDLMGPLEEGLADRGINGCMISTTGCLNVCDRGPVMAVYPEGYWYGNVDEDALEDILDALEEGNAADEYLITQPA